MVDAMLSVRLFGYGVPYQARLDGDDYEFLETNSSVEARDLARAIDGLDQTGKKITSSRMSGNPITHQDLATWAVSMPFGRCGVQDLPIEHLRIFHSAEVWLDVIDGDGFNCRMIGTEEIIDIVPGQVVRLRARPSGHLRVLVAFQTEDRTPLKGNASPFVLDGNVPDAYNMRLKKAWRTFNRVVSLARTDRAAFQKCLDGFFQGMSSHLEGDAEIVAIQRQARELGSYDVDDERQLFRRQRALVNSDVLDRIATEDKSLFRFPGMFGGITTLFNVL